MNKLAKIKSAQLEEVVKNSGLQIQEGEEIKQSYLPFLNQLAEIQDQSTKINFENPAGIDETIARELRLKTVKIRTGAGDLKDGRKRIYLLRGNLEQAAYNLIAASCKLAEEVFTSVEKAREIAEAKRRQELAVTRQIELNPYMEFLPFELNLGNMSDEEYTRILTGAKIQADYKIEMQKKADAERIEKEKEQERIRLENERLKKEAEAKEKQLLAERKAAEEEREAKNRQLLFERKKAEELAAKEHEKAEAKLKTEREAREKLQAEIKAKAVKELQAKKEAEAKVIAELRAKEIADKKAKSAPDKEKLIELARNIEGLILPEMNSDEGKRIINNAKELLLKVSNYIREKTSNL